MRIKKIIKNSISAFSAYILLAILSFVVRKFFLKNINDLFLGYESFFSNIFDVMLVFGLGIDNVIFYKMVKSYSEEDKEEISDLFSIYFYYLKRLLLIIICTSFLIFGGYTLFFDDYGNRLYLFAVFVILMIQFCIKQIVNMYRIIYIVSQEDYKYINIDMISQVVLVVVDFVVLACFKSYLLYILSSLIRVSILLIFVLRISARQYSGMITIKQVTKAKISKYDIRKDLKSNLIQKISLAIYGGTDYILISFLFGMKSLSKLSNYYLVANAINTGLGNIFDPFQPAIGNLMYSDDEPNIQVFDTLNFVGFILGIYAFSFFAVGINGFLGIFFGSVYVIDNRFVMLYSLNIFIAWNHKFLTYYRNSIGHYDVDKGYILIGAILNIVLSLVFSHYLGISGIVLGTIIGHIGFWTGRVRVVFSKYLKTKPTSYLFKQIKYGVILIVDYIILNKFFTNIPNSWSGYFIMLILVFLMVSLLVFLGLLLMGELKKLREYIKIVHSILKGK